MSLDIQVIELALRSLESRVSSHAATTAVSSVKGESLALESDQAKSTWGSLIAIEERVKALALHWQARYTSLTNAAAPISRLPVEVLQQVFITDVTANVDVQRATRLGSVCRKWRDVVNQTSEFWTTIRVPSVNASILPSIVARTKNNPFNLALYNPRLNEPTTKLHLTPNAARRLTSILVVSDDPRRRPSIEITPLESEKELQLERVEMRQEPFVLYERIASWMTSALELILVKTILDNTSELTFDRLRELCISDVSGASASNIFKALNLHAPCLEKICLRGILDHDSMSDPTAVSLIPVELASGILHLTLDKCYTDGWAPFVGQEFPVLKVFETKQRKALASCEYIRVAWWNIVSFPPQDTYAHNLRLLKTS